MHYLKVDHGMRTKEVKKNPTPPLATCAVPASAGPRRRLPPLASSLPSSSPPLPVCRAGPLAGGAGGGGLAASLLLCFGRRGAAQP